MELQKRREPTRVSQVMPHAELVKTEFFNDFLARDGLHSALTLHSSASHFTLHTSHFTLHITLPGLQPRIHRW